MIIFRKQEQGIFNAKMAKIKRIIINIYILINVKYQNWYNFYFRILNLAVVYTEVDK